MLDRMAAFSERVRGGEWSGHTGKPIRNVVNIGIGGSDLGPVMAYEALRHYADARDDLPLRLQRRRHRLRRGDARPRPRGDAVHRLLEDLHHAGDDDQRAHGARVGAGRRCGDEAAIAKHFVAVSTNAEGVDEFGIDTDNMFGFWDWVGGRYSMDSAIGLSTMLAIGPERFREMLAGFHAMDEHFRSAPIEREPAGRCWGCWRSGTATSSAPRRSPCCPTTSTCTASPPTSSSSRWSRTASTSRSTGAPVDYETGAIYWGEPGTNGQHSFYQLIHQGTKLIPCDFIGFCQLAESAGRAPRSADVERLRPDRGARVRQDRRRGAGGGHAGAGSSRTASSRATGPRTRSSPSGSPRAPSARWWPSTSTASSRRARSGVSTRSTSGASSWARCSPRDRPRAPGRERARARPRQLDQRPDPALPRESIRRVRAMGLEQYERVLDVAEERARRYLDEVGAPPGRRAGERPGIAYRPRPKAPRGG